MGRMKDLALEKKTRGPLAAFGEMVRSKAAAAVAAVALGAGALSGLGWVEGEGSSASLMAETGTEAAGSVRELADLSALTEFPLGSEAPRRRGPGAF